MTQEKALSKAVDWALRGSVFRALTVGEALMPYRTFLYAYESPHSITPSNYDFICVVDSNERFDWLTTISREEALRLIRERFVQ